MWKKLIVILCVCVGISNPVQVLAEEFSFDFYMENIAPSREEIIQHVDEQYYDIVDGNPIPKDNAVNQILYESRQVAVDDDYYKVPLPNEQIVTESLDIVDSSTISTYVLDTVNDTSLPDSWDNSTSIYMPPVGSQGGMGSCMAFSTTYYQFTYEKNKILGIASNNNSVIASPRYTYSLVNGGRNGGCYILDVYTALEEHGCVSLNEFAYVGTNFTEEHYRSWPTNETALLNALEVRLDEYNSLTINALTNGGPTITSPDSSEELDVIKAKIVEGKILAVVGRGDRDVIEENNVSYMVRVSTASSYHGYCVVGYDDNVYFDINENGVPEQGEYGAFKIVDNYGTGFANAGYCWLMYDALNGVTSVPEGWESKYTTTRDGAFACGTGTNALYYINVVKTNPYFIAKFNVEADDRSVFSFEVKKKSPSSAIMTSLVPYIYHSGYDEQNTFNIPIDVPMVFDISELITNIDTDYYGRTWRGYFFDSDYTDNLSCTVNDFCLVDNLGNQISSSVFDFGTLTRDRSMGFTINYEKGDVNYDGNIDIDDVSSILNFAAKIAELSNFQKYLGDVNEDGLINASDALQIQQNL